MPHVALIFEFPTTNGGENSMLSIIDQLTPDSEWRFTAILPGDGRLRNECRSRGLECIEWNTRDSNDQKMPIERLTQSLAERLQSMDPDLVHANSLSMSRLLGKVVVDLRVPCSGHIRDIFRVSKATVADLNQLNWIAAVSQATRNFHIDQGLDCDRTSVVYNGIALPNQKAVSQPSIHEQMGLDQNTPLILNAGQLGLRKGQEVLLHAFEMVAKNFPAAHLVLAGERNSSKQESVDFERELHELSSRCNLRGRVHFTGYVPQLADLMSACTMLVHAARQEPLGRVLLEAAAASLPIIATDVGGTREIITEEQSGLLVPPDDQVAMANAIERLLSDSALAARLAAAAHQTASDRFSIENAASQLTDVWSRLISNPIPDTD